MKNIPFLFGPPEAGARTSVYLASSPDVASVSGRFFFRGRAVPSKPITYNENVARQLWEISERLTSITFEVPRSTQPLLVHPVKEILELNS